MTAPDGARIPEPASAAEDEGLPELADDVIGDATGNAAEGSVVPRDHAIAADDFGTTAEEEAAGESLDGRLARELPDTLAPEVFDSDADDREISDDPLRSGGDGYEVGRLVSSDEGARADTEAELTAHSAGIDRGGFSAEEAAMHVDPDS